MKLVIISGDGIGAGKTTLAGMLGLRVSLAEAIRSELRMVLPHYDWYNKTQSYKDTTLVPEMTVGNDAIPTVRQVMVAYGQDRCLASPTYWVDKVIDQLLYAYAGDPVTVVVDDLRKVVERDKFKASFPNCTHVHVSHSRAIHEPEFEAAALKQLADYVVTR